MIILGLLLWQLPQISRYGITFLPGFVVYVMTGLVAAGFTFGALRSYARLSGQQFGLAVDAGGPAAMCLIVMFAGMYGGAAKETFGFSVYIEEAQTQAAVKSGGSATLQLDEPKKRAFQEGHAKFTDIDARWRDQPLDLLIEVDGYGPKREKIKLDEDGQVFRFGLKKKLTPAPAATGPGQEKLQLSKARSLFNAAARQGHPDAERALHTLPVPDSGNPGLSPLEPEMIDLPAGTFRMGDIKARVTATNSRYMQSRWLLLPLVNTK